MEKYEHVMHAVFTTRVIGHKLEEENVTKASPTLRLINHCIIEKAARFRRYRSGERLLQPITRESSLTKMTSERVRALNTSAFPPGSRCL